MQKNNITAYSVPLEKIVAVCKEFYFDKKMQLQTITAVDARKEGEGFKIYYIFGTPKENTFVAPFVIIKDKEEFPSLTPYIQEASIYERRIKSFFGLNPVGHPDLRPALLHENWPTDVYPLRKDFDWQTRLKMAEGNYEFRKIEGEGIYEIPVGPVHAGIIEPGHFRFSVAGEEIVNLEAKLGYKHKGTEKLFEILPLEEKVRLSERVSGDTSFTHSLAFCQAIENLAEIEVPEKAKYLRVIFSELERLQNHFNDIGFIMMDTGYSFGGSNGMRLKEIIMQCNERLTGSRFLRSVNVIGGVNTNISSQVAEELLQMINDLNKDFKEVIDIAEDSITVLNRVKGSGILDRQIAVDHGVIGIAGRAVGIKHDARIDYPYAIYDKLKFEMAIEIEGDVEARMYVRIKEVYSSFEILQQALKNLPPSEKISTDKKIELRKSSLAVGVTEGWRGAVVYVVITDSSGQITRVDVRGPSFLNWSVLGYAGLGNVVPDFPLINKSFSLSYSGNDL